MSEDRKKRLEMIRKKKAEMEKLLREKEAEIEQRKKEKMNQDPAMNNMLTPKSLTEMPSPASSSKTTSRESSRRSHASLLIDPTKNSRLMAIHIKKVNASLRRYSFSEYCRGVYPEMKNEEIQYENPEKQKEELKKKEKENNDIDIENRFKRSSSIYNKDKDRDKNRDNKDQKNDNLNYDEFEEKKKFHLKMMNDEKANELITKNEKALKGLLEGEYNFLDQALSSNDIFDICENYYNENESGINISKRTLATHKSDLVSDQSSNRVVTSLDWSQKQLDLLLAAFSGTNDFNQQIGLIQLWSLFNTETPDYTINYQTEITSSIFHCFNPKIVIGGSYTGQMLLWDIKSKPLPIQKTPLGIGGGNTGKTHSYPITCLAVVGDNSNNNIISISSDGAVCEWSLANLSKPLNRVELKKAIKTDKNDINEIGPLCIGYIPNASKSFLLGSDDYHIYHIRTGETSNDNNIISKFEGNEGPVFSVDVHPIAQEGGNNFSDLFISSGADWTAKLWSTSKTDGPLLSFEQSNDYIYSAKWHPFNPSIFVTGDGNGLIDFWDLNKDLELPIFRYELKNTSINKLSWSCDGKRLAVGDTTGKITIMSAEKDVVNPKAEDINKFEKVVNSLKEKYNENNNDNNNEVNGDKKIKDNKN